MEPTPPEALPRPQRSLARLATAQATPEGDGMVVQRAFPNLHVQRIDPFLLLDEMGPLDVPPGMESGFPDHPHRGFETVTYLLEGDFVHRDSAGNEGHMRPGDVQWMTAGAGLVHSEMPGPDLFRDGGRFRGTQLWVNLPKKDKMVPPRYQGIPAREIPEVALPNGTVRVVAGEFRGQRAAIDTRTPIQYLHVRIQSGALDVPVPDGHEGFVYVLGGSGLAASRDVGPRSLGVLSGTGDVRLEAGRDGLDILVVTGVPLREPVVQWGPFVMTNRAEIEQAVRDYQSGKMGAIAPAGRA